MYPIIIFFFQTHASQCSRVGERKMVNRHTLGFLKKKNAVYVIFILARHVPISLAVVGGTMTKNNNNNDCKNKNRGEI